MAKAQAFDVWFVQANTVYKKVPYRVVLNWLESDRVGAEDMIRASGTEEWTKLGEVPQFAALATPPEPPPPPPQADGEFELEPPGGPAATDAARPAPPPAAPRPTEDDALALEPIETGFPARRREAEDQEVDMVPLIDISLVLLIFFMLTLTPALSFPVDVPVSQDTFDPRLDPTAIWVGMKGEPGQTRYWLSRGKQPPRPGDSDLTFDAFRAKLAQMIDANERPENVFIAADKKTDTDLIVTLTALIGNLKGQGKPVGKVFAQVSPEEGRR